MILRILMGMLVSCSVNAQVTTFTTPVSTISIHTGGNGPVLVLKKDGGLTWKGKEIESDEQLKQAVKDLAQILNRGCGPYLEILK